MSKSLRLWLNLVEWAVLSLAVAAFTITEEYRWYISAGLLLLPAAFGLRWARTGKLLPRSGLEIPLLVFLGSAGLATWIAVDRPTALLQFARMLAAAVMFYAVIHSEKSLRPWLAGGMLLVGLGLALYWPLQHDFSADVGKFPRIAQAGMWLREHLPTIPGPFVHAYVAASTFAPALAFALALAAWAGKRRPWLALLATLAALPLVAGLVLTSSRGAWLGVAVTALLAGLVLVQQRWLHTRLARRLTWGAVTLVGGLGLAFLIFTGMLEPLLGQVPDPSGSLQSRLSLFGQVGRLISDAPFSGYGLMGFRPVYATYGLLIHVPFHYHAHNTYLEVGMEQGLFGLLALVWGMGTLVWWAWRSLETGKSSPWGWAGLAALGVLAVHSLFDVVYYVTRPLPLIGLFAGMTWMLHEAAVQGAPAAAKGKRKLGWLVAAAGGLAGAVLLLAFFRPLAARFYANLGVIEQTRLELSAYDAAHFDNPTLDEVRQQLDLSQAVSYYQQARRWNPVDRTALQRLAQIYMSLGDYSQALTWSQAAWYVGYRDEITRLTYGDALVAIGEPQAAAEIVSGLPWATGRLNTQAWYRYYRQADYARANYAWQAVLVLDPNDAHALSGMELLQKP